MDRLLGEAGESLNSGPECLLIPDFIYYFGKQDIIY